MYSWKDIKNWGASTLGGGYFWDHLNFRPNLSLSLLSLLLLSLLLFSLLLSISFPVESIKTNLFPSLLVVVGKFETLPPVSSKILCLRFNLPQILSTDQAADHNDNVFVSVLTYSRICIFICICMLAYLYLFPKSLSSLSVSIAHVSDHNSRDNLLFGNNFAFYMKLLRH